MAGLPELQSLSSYGSLVCSEIISLWSSFSVFPSTTDLIIASVLVWFHFKERCISESRLLLYVCDSVLEVTRFDKPLNI